jgi:hypothetical protein
VRWLRRQPEVDRPPRVDRPLLWLALVPLAALLGGVVGRHFVPAVQAGALAAVVVALVWRALPR